MKNLSAVFLVVLLIGSGCASATTALRPGWYNTSLTVAQKKKIAETVAKQMTFNLILQKAVRSLR